LNHKSLHFQVLDDKSENKTTLLQVQQNFHHRFIEGQTKEYQVLPYSRY